MAIKQKFIDISDKFSSAQEFAEQTKGIWMNMLNAVYYNEVDNKYHMSPIKYSDTNLTGEKIKFSSGQELTVVFSCLAEEFAHKKEVKDAWWKKANELVEAYKEEMKLDAHIKSNNTDLKKLRKEGALLNQEELDKEYD